MIQAITFDFWNTLFEGTFATELRCRKIKRALERVGHAHISEARIQEAAGVAWREWDRVWMQEQRTFGAARWVALVLADLGVNLPQPEQEALVQAVLASGMEVKPPLIDGVAGVLPRLAQRYKLGLVCDTGLTPGWMLRQWMDTHDILRHFDHLTFSNELGVSKPHPRAFLSTLEALNVPPEAAVHVGDNPRTDVEGAQGVGMRAIRFLGPYRWPDSAVQADAEFADYGALETLLEQL